MRIHRPDTGIQVYPTQFQPVKKSNNKKNKTLSPTGGGEGGGGVGSALAAAVIVLHVCLGCWVGSAPTAPLVVVLHVLDVLEGGLHLLLHLFILLLGRQQVVWKSRAVAGWSTEGVGLEMGKERGGGGKRNYILWETFFLHCVYCVCVLW